MQGVGQVKNAPLMHGSCASVGVVASNGGGKTVKKTEAMSGCNSVTIDLIRVSLLVWGLQRLTRWPLLGKGAWVIEAWIFM